MAASNFDCLSVKCGMDFFNSGKASRHLPFSAKPTPCAAEAAKSTAAALFGAGVAAEVCACARQQGATNPAIHKVRSKQVGLIMN